MNIISRSCSAINYEVVKEGLSKVGAQIINDPLNVIGSVTWSIFKSLAVYNMYEAALSDILCLKTFRHGTSPSAWLKIHLTGPDLERGGNGGEAEYYKQRGKLSPYAARDHGRFYAVQDNLEKEGCGKLSIAQRAFSHFDNRGTVKYYSLRSTVTYYASWVPLPTSIKAPILEAVVRIFENPDPRIRVWGLFSPTVKIHLDPDRVSYPDQLNNPSQIKHNFEPDEYSAYGQSFSGACYTEDPISVFDLGICGVLKNGLNTRLFQRISDNKEQFLWGVAQLVVAVAATALFFPALVPGGDALLSIMARPIAAIISIPHIGETLGGPVIGVGIIASAFFLAAQF